MFRHLRFAFVIVALTLSVSLTLSQQASHPRGGRAGEPEDPREMSKDPNGGIRRFLNMRTFGGKPIPSGAYQKAQLQWEKLRNTASHAARPADGRSALPESVTSLSGTVWKPIGPSPMVSGSSSFNGRV